MTYNLNTGRLYHLTQNGIGAKWKVQSIARPRAKVNKPFRIILGTVTHHLTEEQQTRILEFYNKHFPEWPITDPKVNPHDPIDKACLVFRALQTPVWTLLVRSGLPGLAREIAYSGEPLSDEHATDPLRALNITSFELELLRRIDCFYFSDYSRFSSPQSNLPSVRYQTHLNWEGLLINLRSIIETWRVEDLRRLTNLQLDNLLHLDRLLYTELAEGIARYRLPRLQTYMRLLDLNYYDMTLLRDTFRAAEALEMTSLGINVTRLFAELRPFHDKLAARLKGRQNVIYDGQIVRHAAAHQHLEGVLDDTEDLAVVIPRTSTDLYREGAAMGHCVGSYTRAMANGATLIAFIHKAGESYVTLEINPVTQQLVQAKMKDNRLPDRPVAERIAEWCKSKSIAIRFGGRVCYDLRALE